MRNSVPASWLNGEVKKFYLEMLSIFKDYSGFFHFSFNVFGYSSGFEAAKSRTFQYGAYFKFVLVEFECELNFSWIIVLVTNRNSVYFLLV